MKIKLFIIFFNLKLNTDNKETELLYFATQLKNQMKSRCF